MEAFFLCFEKDFVVLHPYAKPYQNSEQLCAKLIGQNLNITDIPQAKKTLEKCSYYRFKAYLYPFQDNATKQFHPNISFTNAEDLYRFDEDLRLLVFKLIQKIEISIRSSFDQWMTSNLNPNNSFWYLDSSLFELNAIHASTINKVRNMFIGSEEEFAKHYQSKYYNTYCPFYRNLPPAWVAIELMSFGNLTKLMQSITEDTITNVKLDRFSNRKLGIQKFKTLSSWMTVIQNIRNYCCHHSRLFNRNIPAPVAIKRHLSNSIQLVKVTNSKGIQEDQLNRIYTGLAAIQVITSKLGYPKFGNEIQTLFTTYPIAQRLMPSMGFPANWLQETLFF